MTNHEQIKRAFAPLTSSEDNLTEVLMKTQQTKAKRIPFYKTKRAWAIAAAAVLLCAGAAAAAGTTILRTIKGTNGNFEEIETEEGITGVLHTDDLTDFAEVRGDKLFFIACKEETDITDAVLSGEAYRYDYTDEDGIVHTLLVGIEDGDITRFGYAEYLMDTDGKWLTGYSARVNADVPEDHWLPKAKKALGVPW